MSRFLLRTSTPSLKKSKRPYLAEYARVPIVFGARVVLCPERGNRFQCIIHAVLPAKKKWREFELRALGLRDFAGLRTTREPLDPDILAKYANLRVVSLDQIELSEESFRHLTGSGKDEWSGGACSQPLPDGTKLIILNPSHPPTRTRATLMEEIAHVFLGHKPSRLAVKSKNGEETRTRDYHHEIEEEAYAVGAAALVPFEGLSHFVGEGKSSREIARHFRVSKALVEFRIKTTKLWQRYLDEQQTRQY